MAKKLQVFGNFSDIYEKNINERLRSIDGNIVLEFEIGQISLTDNALVYSASNYNVRTKEGVVYSVPSGTTFTLSDYADNSLFVYYSYDGGVTYSSVSIKASSGMPFVVKQDALVAIKIQAAKRQTDTSLSSLLVVDVQTVSKSINDLDEKVDSFIPLIETDLNNANLWVRGSINPSGTDYKYTASLRTTGYISNAVELVYAENDYFFNVFVYDSEGVFQGFWDGKGLATESKALYYFNPKGLQDYNIRLLCRRYGASDEYVMDVSESYNIHLLNGTHKNAFFQKPTLTFIDDDASVEALANWEAIADEIGVKITSAVVTGVVGDDAHITWDEIKRLQNKGFEFVSHTHYHKNITTISEEVCEQDFKNSITALREHGCESRYLVYPYNTVYDTETGIDRTALVKKYFSAGVGMSHERDNVLPIRTCDIRRYSINSEVLREDGSAPLKDLETLKSYIDTAIANHSWVIIMTHLRNTEGSLYYNEAEDKQTIIDLCKYATEKGMAIQTFGEAFNRYKNVLENGSASGNSYYIVDCNGITHYRGQTTST